ncbi:MAG: DegT/DnrJ/EryC1/StrS family aminotransferase [bacterium]
MWKIPLFDLNYDDKESKAALDVINNKWLTTGPKTQEFEKNFSEYLGNNVYSTAVSSCTAALHLALLACGIGAGDEVIISGLTFVACLNMVSITGAIPVLADSKSLYDWNVCSNDIESKITDKTKAVIIVHFAGYPCDMNEIKAITDKYNLILIEDVAHAVGGSYKNEKCGTIGDIGCFSFFSNKNLSVGEGGMITTKNADLHQKFKLLRSHGMTSMTIERHNSRTISYDVVIPGLNYRIDEIRSAIGIEQLKKLDESNLKRQKTVKLYHSLLENINGLIIPWTDDFTDRISSYHIFPVLLPVNADRPNVMEKMKAQGIQTSLHYPAFNQFEHYKNIIEQDLIVANEISSRVLTLPLYPTMTKDDVAYVCNSLKSILG